MGAKTDPQSLQLGVDDQLSDRALRALLKHHESSSSSADGGKDQLLGDDLDVQVQFTLGRIPGNSSAKPIRIEIPHPLVKVAADGDNDDMDVDDHLQDAEVCLIVKESSKPWVQEMIARFPKELGCIKKVLGLQSLRTKHKSFNQRRELLARFDIFLADDRILPMLTKALGVKFFDKKKQPVPVRLTREEALPFAVQRCLRSTFMYLSSGTCLTVKAGSTAMPPAKLLANVQSICSTVPTKVPKKWSNVRSIAIKTSASVALPIYNKTPEELEQIMKLAREQGRELKDANVEAKEDGGKKKKRKMAATTPLAKALKKSKAEKDEDVVAEKPKKSAKKRKNEPVEEGGAEEETGASAAKAPKSSKKKKKKVEEEPIDSPTEEVVKETKTPKSSKKKTKKVEKVDDEETPAVSAKKESKTPKSSKKKKKKEADDEESAAVSAKKESKTPKSSKKGKNKEVEDESKESKDEYFIYSKKFTGAKKGYIFRKSKNGLGYYKDVLPVVTFSHKTTKKSGGGRKSMGHSMKNKRTGGKGRRSF